MGGALIRNENSAAFSASTPPALAAESVIPERETPGSIATAWATPIHKAPKKDIPPRPCGRSFVALKITPVNMRDIATALGEANAVSMQSFSSMPTIPAGTADRTILRA